MQTFFYGLFMDADLLREKGVRATNPRIARLDGHRLHIGKRAALVEQAGQSVYGILMDVADEDLQRLYSEPGVDAYLPQECSVTSRNGRHEAAVTYNLPASLVDSTPNAVYAQKLQRLATKLGLPPEYVARMPAAGEESA